VLWTNLSKSVNIEVQTSSEVKKKFEIEDFFMSNTKKCESDVGNEFLKKFPKKFLNLKNWFYVNLLKRKRNLKILHIY